MLSSQILWHLASMAVRSLGLAAMAWMAIGIVRLKSPAARHAVWTLVVTGMLLLAILEPVLPSLPLRVLRAAGGAGNPPIELGRGSAHRWLAAACDPAARGLGRVGVRQAGGGAGA